MPKLNQITFACIDCEATGLDPVNDRIIEVAVATFTLDGMVAQYEALVNPERPIPAASQEIHHISDEMVAGQRTIQELLPDLLSLIGRHPIIGHSVHFDIDLLVNSAKRHEIPCTLKTNTMLDTLRLARLYGESPTNSLAQLRNHFNIPEEGAHRAMNDVLVNIEVFKQLVRRFTTLEEITNVLSKPIAMRAMPLGKHKGRPFKEIPVEYLRWAVHQEFDQDLMHSLREELRRRQSGRNFMLASNPFGAL